jgi:hypothetical protein
VRRCLRKSPSSRYPNAAALAAALAPLASERGKILARQLTLDGKARQTVEAATRAREASGVAATLTSAPAVSDRSPRTRQVQAWKLGALALLGVAGVAVGGGLASRASKNPAAPSRPLAEEQAAARAAPEPQTSSIGVDAAMQPVFLPPASSGVNPTKPAVRPSTPERRSPPSASAGRVAHPPESLPAGSLSSAPRARDPLDDHL